MAVNTDEAGKSVYTSATRDEHDLKSEQPLYASVREIVRRIAPDPRDTLIIDLGCSDLVASGPLINEGYRVVGLDLDEGSLHQAKEFYPNAHVILGDVRHVPIDTWEYAHKVVLLLDILEHLEPSDAVEALKNLKVQMGKNCAVVVSMPNISPFSYYTIRDASKMLLTGKRPATGLFDRTHKTLTDLEGHLEIFRQAGYKVTDMHVTSRDEGVSGDWEWKKVASDNHKESGNNQPISHSRELAEKAYRLIFGKVAPLIASSIRRVNIEEARLITTGYQGLYVLYPEDD